MEGRQLFLCCQRARDQLKVISKQQQGQCHIQGLDHPSAQGGQSRGSRAVGLG
jgi:hypothetical protein